ncbi:DUF2087 domain-containing protein [Fuscovulum blasticum]|uniref:DUF2087 domain-containing protein n=1 Tax=Fuscovulum blasticum TaxID=1075 RepID=UPI000D3EE0B5|nr:DUF2087 domain-containing protein [Fuscovulum blasticum]AWD21503.1 hypothetical protein B6K69_07280 [Fuscovulum blasticum]
MTRTLVPLLVADLSAFTRALARQLTAAESPPSHQTLMNMLARAAGFRNLQHLGAAQAAAARLDSPPPPPEAVDHTLVARALNQFDATGRLVGWPARRNVQVLCLWALWARLPVGGSRTERQFSALLNGLHSFGDAALLRRDMVMLGLIRRAPDGTDYARLEQRPPPEARALIRHLALRGTGG